jgi:uncharacterized protein with von Willebrand factor type A (vWA) domain
LSGAHGLVAQLARFAGALRSRGVRVGLSEEIDAAAALALVDLLDRAEVHRTLRIALRLPRDAWDLFDRLFEEYWDGRRAPLHEALDQAMKRDARGPAQWRWDGQRVRLEMPDERERPEGDTPSYSPEAALRRKPFEEFSESDLAALERMVAQLARKLATRRSRRLVPTSARGLVDLRRSFRRSLSSEGDFLKLARRARPLDEANLVILYDTSGSMDVYTRVLLPFAFALRRVVRRVEIFAFNTTLVRVTRMIAPGKAAQSLGALAAGVPDGLDQGETDLLERSMRELRERVGKIIWLNPLLGDARYRPECAGMRAALPYVDHFGPAHNLASLQCLLRVLA